MISLIYIVDPKDVDDEKEFLRDMKVYPACENYFDWIKGKNYVKFGVIVSPEAALSIKLRHVILSQKEYVQR